MTRVCLLIEEIADYVDKVVELFLFLQARTLTSSAVRLNVIGPYQGNQVLFQIQEEIEGLVREFHEKGGGEVSETAYQPCPFLDIVQGYHDRLYSRLFNSWYRLFDD